MWEEEGLAPSAIFFSRSIRYPQTTAVLHPKPPPPPPAPPSSAILRRVPHSRSPPAPPHPGGRGGGLQRGLAEKQGQHAPPPGPRPPLHCPGGAQAPSPRLLAPGRAPPPGAAAPAAPRRFPGASFWRGGACSAKDAGSVTEEGIGGRGGGPGRPRPVRGRSGSAAISRGRCPRDERRAAGSSWPSWEGRGSAG